MEFKLANIDDIDFDKANGLLPAIIREHESKEILMLAYMNRESFEKTLATKTTHFFSRTRSKLWNKGETSGHFQKVKNIYLDCDKDTLLIDVEQLGVACHTGNKTCFFRKIL